MTTRVAILGANGRIARCVIRMLATRADVKMTLLLRDPRRFDEPVPAGTILIEADVLDAPWLYTAVSDQDVVVASLSGKTDEQARAIITAMHAEGVRRLVFVAAFGIYDEVPQRSGVLRGQSVGPWLGPCRRAADRIEAAGLAATILRPAWLTDEDEIAWDTTERHEPFRGTEVSRRSVASLIVAAIDAPEHWSGRNVGISRPDDPVRGTPLAQSG